MNRYLKIFFVLLIAFTLSSFLNRNVFLSNTPRINYANLAKIYTYPSLLKNNLALVINNFKFRTSFTAKLPNNTGNEFNNLNNNQLSNSKGYFELEKVISKTVFNQAAKGVYAGETDGTVVKKYVENEIVWKEYTFTLSSGKVVVIKVPTGEDPPTQAEAEQVYGN